MNPPKFGERIWITDGPHAGISTYPRPVPRYLMCLDQTFCYHEYLRIPAQHGITRYRYLRRVGHPHWAAWATHQKDHETNNRSQSH